MRWQAIRNWLDFVGSALIVIIALVLVWRVGKEELGYTRPTPTKAIVKAPKAPALAVPAEPISLVGTSRRGNPTARVVLIEFSDFQCPFCARFAQQVLPALLEKYVDSGRVEFAFMNMPLEDLHPLARRAAQAAECAEAQGKFWPMHDQLFAPAKDLSEPGLQTKAKEAGLDIAAFGRCMAERNPAMVETDVVQGKALHVTGTPTFFVGMPLPEQKVQLLSSLVGAVPLDQFSAVIDAALMKVGK